VRNAGLPLPENLAELALNGCRPENLEPAEFQRIIQHFTVAHLRAAFGIGNPSAGLAPAVAGAFDPVEVLYRTAPEPR